MKNKELIELLSQLPADLDIVFTNNNGDYTGENIDEPKIGEYWWSERITINYDERDKLINDGIIPTIKFFNMNEEFKTCMYYKGNIRDVILINSDCCNE